MAETAVGANVAGLPLRSNAADITSGGHLTVTRPPAEQWRRLSPGGRHGALTAVADGTVVLADDLFFTGNAVFIDHNNGSISMYFHLRELEVKAGQAVTRGEAIGTVGSTGRVTGPHLHMGMRWHGARVDPALLVADPTQIRAIAP